MDGDGDASSEMTEDTMTTDSTTSFELNSVATHTYSERTEDDSEGVGTETGDSADEVDPRQLMGNPSVNELRWLYRTFWASTLVDKPVDDAFKNGFDIEHDGQRDVGGLLDDLNWTEHYKDVKKKARRDGFALSYFVLEDSTDAVWEDPMEADVVRGIKKLDMLTLDDMARFKASHGAIPPGSDADPLEDLDYTDYEIRPTGIVMDTDPMSDTYKEPLGYLVGPPDWIDKSDALDRVKFYHRNRVIHHVENRTVDGDLLDDSLGRWEGDSVLTSSYHLLRGLKKGNWSLMQTVFRYAAKMYHVALPEDADEDDWDQAEGNIQNLNAKSELITPANYEIQDFQTDGQLDPEEYFDVVFKQVCASNEMTKSVLFGTQVGTTTGSETDIKNYFNQVERLRKGNIENDMRAFVSRSISLVDSRTSADYDLDFDVEWGAMFKMSELDNAERLSRVMQTLSAAINDFILTPQEARSILQEEWAEADIEWSDSFSEEERDFLKTLNVAQMGTEAVLEGSGEPTEMEGNPQVGQNGGGQERGQTTDPDNPANDGLSESDVDRIAERVATLIG